MYQSLNAIVWDYSNKFSKISSDELVNSRNDSSLGMCREMIDESITLANPRARNLYLYGRKNNPFATWAEILWVFGGTKELSPVMTNFLPRSTQFSDDGHSWRGAYNTRISKYNLLQHIIDMYKEDGINTRRACFSIWSPELDSYNSIHRQIGDKKTKDIPCSNFVWTWIRDNKFNMKVSLRSNDFIWGLSNINIPEFTFMQEVLLEFIKRDITEFYPVTLGSYTHNPISLHVYESTYKQVESISNRLINLSLLRPLFTYPVRITENKNIGIKAFFRNIYKFFEREVLNIDSVISKQDILNHVNNYFLQNNISPSANILFIYVLLPLLYLYFKKSGKSEYDIVNSIKVFDVLIPEEIRKCLDVRYLDIRNINKA